MIKENEKGIITDHSAMMLFLLPDYDPHVSGKYSFMLYFCFFTCICENMLIPSKQIFIRTIRIDST